MTFSALRAAAQHPAVVGAPERDAGGIEVLEVRLGELARRAQFVAQAPEGDSAVGADQLAHTALDGGQGVGVGVEVASDAHDAPRGPQLGQVPAGVASSVVDGGA